MGDALTAQAGAMYRMIIAAIKTKIHTSPFMQAMAGKYLDFKLTDEYAVALNR